MADDQSPIVFPDGSLLRPRLTWDHSDLPTFDTGSRLTLSAGPVTPEPQTPEPPTCVCQVDDGLVQEWVSKARAVAISKGFNPLPRCCRDMGDGYVCVLWKGHEGGCSGHREAAPRPSMAAALDRIGHIINDAPYRLEERDGAWQAFLQNRAIIEGAK